MSISIGRTIPQLKAECERLSLNPIPTKVTKKNPEPTFQKDDYVWAIRNYYINKMWGNLDNAPTPIRLALAYEQLMVCTQMKDTSEEQQKKMWADTEEGATEGWVEEIKHDGVRMATQIFLGGGFGAFSRNNSDVNALPIPYGSKIYLGDIDWSKIQNTFILDNEIICTNPNINTALSETKGIVTETQLQAVTALLSMNKDDSIYLQKLYDRPLKFMAFDCIYWDGEWLFDKPLHERRQYLLKSVSQLLDAGFNVEANDIVYKNKKAFYQSVIKQGGEGCILKDLSSTYRPVSSRKHRSWVKAKKTMTEMLSLEGGGDTIDAYITGYAPGSGENEGKIGSFEVSIYMELEDGTKVPHVIGMIGGISDELRDDMTCHDTDNNVILNPKYYNQVVEVDGYGISSRKLRLRHATLIRFRNDKSLDECVYTEKFIKSMIL